MIYNSFCSSLPIVLSALIILSSCASKSEKEVRGYSNEVVAIDFDKKKAKVKIKRKHAPNPLLEPRQLSKEKDLKEDSLYLEEAYFLMPAGARSACYSGYLRSLGDTNKRIPFIGGGGIGLLISTWYLKDYGKTNVDWNLFKLAKQLRDFSYLGERWTEEIEKFVKITQQDLSALKSLLFLPRYKNGYFISFLDEIPQGLQKKVIEEGTHHTQNNIDRLISSNGYNLGLDFEVALQKRGITKLIVLNALGDRVAFKKGNGLLVGYFRKLMQLSLESNNIEIEERKIDCNKFDLDDFGEFRSMIEVGKKFYESLN